MSTSLCANIYSLAGASKLGRLVLDSLWVTAKPCQQLVVRHFSFRNVGDGLLLRWNATMGIRGS
jgi:hypothetical protein